MGLPTEILEFFNTSNAETKNNKVVPFSVGDFIKGKKGVDLMKVRMICQKFGNEGLLIHSGIKNNSPLTGDSYYNFGYNKELAIYGSYDFLIDGFLSIRNYFTSSVKPVVVKTQGGIDDIGTCFVIGENFLVTAFHCICQMESIKILDTDNNIVKAKQIWTPKDPRKDIAVIELEGTPFSNSAHFRIGNGQILDQVLTMGYPPISGFDAIQFAEISTINTSIKSSTGNLIGKDKSYLDGQDYLLINARVKGGNSGGPIINNLGMVVGMLVHIPTDPSDSKKLDLLGYGVAIPGNEMLQVFNQINGNHEDIESIYFENFEKGFKTIKK